MSGIPKTLEVLALLLVVLADPVPAPDRPSQPKIVASPTSAVVQPVIPVGAPVPLDAGKFVFLDVQGHTGPITWEFSKTGIVALLPDAPAGAAVSDHFPGIKQGESAPAWHKAPSKTAVPCLGVSGGSTTISAWGVLDGRAKKIAELTMQVGPAPPKPDEPKPDDPKPPQPVTSFRVFLVYESGATYSSAVNSVLYGNAVEEWLNANCTGGKAGWRRRDKDLSGDADPTMAAMWNAVKPAVTTIPCAAVEVNGKVEIIPLGKTPAEMVATFKKYREGK